MVAGNTRSSLPVVILDKRKLNEPAIVLLGYLVLAIFITLDNQSPNHVWLAIILALFGSGSSTVAVLFPRPNDLDVVERVALSACLSITIGGLLGYALARSPWGLTLWPFMIVLVFYNLVCYLFTWYRRRHLGNEEMIIQWDNRNLYLWWKNDPGSLSRLKTISLLLLLITGIWMMAQKLGQPVRDPSLTEFYMLDQNGQTELYPKIGRPGERLDMLYGITNRENEPVAYHIQALIAGEKVGVSRPVQLGTTETHIGQVEINIPDSLTGLKKVEFVLYRDEKPYRLLYLWIDVARP